MKFKKGDYVKIISGEFKGRTGKIRIVYNGTDNLLMTGYDLGLQLSNSPYWYGFDIKEIKKISKEEYIASLI